jgi:hypothetical protein
MEDRVAGTINDIVKSIAEAPKISGCLTGRDMSQIRSSGSENGKNVARFPRMFDSYAKTIIRDGKSQAIKNYEKSVKKSKESLKKQAITNAADALNQTDYSPEEKEGLVRMISSSVNAL